MAMEIDFAKENIELPEIKYEYLDHTADVQLHAWGDTFEEAYEQCGMAMFGYMTELPYVEIENCYQFSVRASDMENLLFHFLDELLFLFSAEPYLICRKLKMTYFNPDTFELECKCYGETFDIQKHPQGTEVKAITYSAMQVYENPETNLCEVFVIIDI